MQIWLCRNPPHRLDLDRMVPRSMVGSGWGWRRQLLPHASRRRRPQRQSARIAAMLPVWQRRLRVPSSTPGSTSDPVSHAPSPVGAEMADAALATRPVGVRRWQPSRQLARHAGWWLHGLRLRASSCLQPLPPAVGVTSDASPAAAGEPASCLAPHPRGDSSGRAWGGAAPLGLRARSGAHRAGECDGGRPQREAAPWKRRWRGGLASPPSRRQAAVAIGAPRRTDVATAAAVVSCALIEGARPLPAVSEPDFGAPGRTPAGAGR